MRMVSREGNVRNVYLDVHGALKSEEPGIIRLGGEEIKKAIRYFLLRTPKSVFLVCKEEAPYIICRFSGDKDDYIVPVELNGAEQEKFIK